MTMKGCCTFLLLAALLPTLLFLVSGDCIGLDLGMESVAITDNQTTSSSQLNVGTPARNGRLNYIYGSSWCASSGDNYPYLQIDLQELHIVCAVSTQGNSRTDDWIKTYTLQLSTDGRVWTNYTEDGQVKIFPGNNDRNTKKKNIIFNGLLTRWLRFVGKSCHNKFCMRAEVYGVKVKPENLAAGKPTGQSSTYNDSFASGESFKAVDGNSDTNYNNSHCSRTLVGDPSWWRVDLGSLPVPVFEVRIINRFSSSDDLRQRNKGFKITLGNSPRVTDNSQCIGQYSFSNFITSAVCYNNPLRTGRYVGIVTAKKELLQLCEVEIYSRENMAFRKRTYQSSMRPGSDDAYRAVDGNSNPLFHKNSCSHTDEETNPWWRVDLGRVEPVNEVYIVNRGDCCGKRLNAFEIRVGINSSDVGTANPKCRDGVYSVPQNQGASFYCRPSLYGRYVTIRVTKTYSGALTLCEVEVYSGRRACQIQTIGLASSYHFPRERFSASSSSVGNEAFEGRLNGNGAWSPSTDKNANDYLQIDLIYEYFICAVATQGNRIANHWTTKYKLHLSLNNTQWDTYRENGVDKIFHANGGKSDIVKNHLVNISTAKFIRFQPTEFSTRKALRVELYGILKPAVPSQPPASLTVTARTSTSISASWTLPPEDSINGVLTGFKLFFKKRDSFGPSSVIIIHGVTTFSKNVTGLNKYTEYEFNVLAFTSAGDGLKGPVKVQRTKEDVPSKCPSGFTVTANTSTSIVASWQLPPVDSRNGIIKGFKLFYRQKGCTDRPTTLVNNGKEFLRVVPGLKKYTEYEFQVSAFSFVGNGPKSSLMLERTNEDVPSKAPFGFTVTASTSTSIVTSWQLPPVDSRNGIIKGFKLFYRQKGSTDPSTMLVNNGKEFIRVVHGLKKYTEYEFQVLAFTSVGDGPKSSLVLERTKEDVPSQAPTNFSVSAGTSTSIDVAWQLPPAASRNGLITGFKLFYKKPESHETPTIIMIDDGVIHTKTVKGLDKYTEYEFKVLAFNSAGEGPKSSAVVQKTKEDVPSQAPSSFTVVAQTSSSILATWQLPPLNSSNGIIAGFKLFYKTKDRVCAANVMIKTESATHRRKIVTGLDKYTEYVFQVLAFTSAGDGPRSSEKVSRTKEGDPPFVQKLPEKITLMVGDYKLLTCDVSGVPDPLITWRKNGNTNITRARLQENGRVLFIAQVIPDDKGFYECQAINKFGETRTATTVLVAVPPRIDKDASSTSVTCKKQTLCLLSCTAASDFPIIYSWMKNGQILQGNKQGTMAIKPHDAKDYGVYVCNATNNYGSAIHSITVAEYEQTSVTDRRTKTDNNDVFRATVPVLSCVVILLLIVIVVLVWRLRRRAVSDLTRGQHASGPIPYMELDKLTCTT